MSIKLTQSELNAIIAARTEANKAKAQLFVQPKAAFVGGAVVGLYKGLVAGFTSGTAEPEFEIVAETTEA